MTRILFMINYAEELKKTTLQPVFENRYVFLYHNLTIKV